MRARTILVHLNVTAPDDDNRSIGEIAEAIQGAIEVGSDDPSLSGLIVQTALVDEIDSDSSNPVPVGFVSWYRERYSAYPPPRRS